EALGLWRHRPVRDGRPALLDQEQGRDAALARRRPARRKCVQHSDNGIIQQRGVRYILMMLAAAALTQWTGPRTEEYKGPGYFCGGGYAVHLTRGERALILPQGQAPQATRLVLSGGEVNILTGAHREAGKVVL